FPCAVIILSLPLFASVACVIRCLHPFPTRRSSDLVVAGGRSRTIVGEVKDVPQLAREVPAAPEVFIPATQGGEPPRTIVVGTKVDRKSTRLNSSHGSISYAVFCLKKKKNKTGKQ